MCEVDNQATAKTSLRSEENKKIFKEDISRRNLHIYQGMLLVSLFINTQMEFIMFYLRLT